LSVSGLVLVSPLRLAAGSVVAFAGWSLLVMRLEVLAGEAVVLIAEFLFLP
jgi:hypothetical protein